jgi:hypothetical protein
MDEQHNIANFALPLIAKSNLGKHRYMGTATILEGDKKILLTCAHIVSELRHDEQLLLSVYESGYCLGDYYLDKFTVDESMDIAYIALNDPKIKSKISVESIKNTKQDILLCQDIMAFGYISPNPNASPIELQPQVRKGYVSWTSPRPAPEVGGKTLNVSSYPNPKGFSGGPVFLANSTTLIGMSYNNLVSEVCAYEHTEIHENGLPRYKEVKSQIIENGVFHSIQDIQYFLQKNNLC